MGMNYLEFGGEKTSDYGVYVSGEGTFNAPDRDVEMISIPGRNGSIVMDKGRFQNIEVTYPAFNFSDTAEQFRDRLSALRNAMCSKIGYQKLTDTYHPDEFRMAVYKSGLEAKPVQYNTAAGYDLKFDCKPQRFLVSGEDPKTIGEWGETETETGEIVTIDNPDGTMAFKSLQVTLTPIQDLHGYDSPWVGGAGKNLLDTSRMSTTGQNGVTFTRASDGVITVGGSANANAYRLVGSIQTENGVQYTLTGTPSGGASGKYRMAVVGYGYDFGNGYTFTGDGNSHDVSVDIYSGYPKSGTLIFKPMIRLATETDSTYEPYENICPISGWDEVSGYVSATTDEEDATVYTTTLPQTVYGGTLDMVSGEVVIDRAMVDLGSLNWSYNAGGYFDGYLKSVQDTIKRPTSGASLVGVISSQYVENTSNQVYNGTNEGVIAVRNTNGDIWVRDVSKGTDASDFKTAMNGVQLVYPLATPQTYQLTPQQINTLLGQNNVWSDAGEVSVEFGQDPGILVNPTQFPSKPLIKVTGAGVLSVGKYMITITGESGQTLYIDCESMEIYKNNGGVVEGASSLVSFSTPEFPELSEGINGVSAGDGITSVEITPRWWRL